MTDVKQGGIVLSLPQCDSIASCWEINSKTGAVRFKGPKTGEEKHVYPDYERKADKTAKAICRVLRRKLPRSDAQRDRTDKASRTRKEDESSLRKGSKAKAGETEEESFDSEYESETEYSDTESTYESD